MAFSFLYLAFRALLAAVGCENSVTWICREIALLG